MRLLEQLSAAAVAATVVAGWETSMMPEKLRKELCAEQVLFCTNVCGGENLTREAFCNSNTLGSKCACSNGAEAAIKRYQWPAFQRVCEIQRQECRAACDRSNIAAHEKSFCFNSCDTRMACNTENAPDLKIMVQKFDDVTTGSAPKPKPKIEANADGSPVVVAINGGDGAKDSKIKEKTGSKDGKPKRRGGPLPTGNSNAAVALSPASMLANGALAAVLAAAAVSSGGLF
ncbi:hypothetical protein GGI15_002019 [Coemansia interrupta]|uniref:DUF7707 domain-containing protein n=1 Tax=Coemansia interrupta TaxID=1126814 RepID=A0A9W8HHA8_9FUNG|nr:hypothetical protein GGI15_002019 [Coemansia interrupta]